jgi:putative ABC transport system permease protein
MGILMADLRIAWRSLTRSWASTVVAVLTLTIAIGAPTAIFSIVRGVILRPLPFHAPDRLVALCEGERGKPLDFCGISPPDLSDVVARSRTLSSAGLARGWPFVMKTVDGTEGIDGAVATSGYLPCSAGSSTPTTSAPGGATSSSSTDSSGRPGSPVTAA